MAAYILINGWWVMSRVRSKRLMIFVLILQLVSCSSTSHKEQGSEGKESVEFGSSTIPRNQPAFETSEEDEGGGAGAAAETDDQSSRIYRGTGKLINLGAASAPHYAESGEGDVTLNFQNTDIKEVIKTILGDILQANFVVDEKVIGKITLHTSRPLPRVAVIPTLEALLRLNGATLIKSDGLFKVVPDSDAFGGIGGPRLQLSPNLGFQGIIVPLRYIGAKEMHKIIEPMKPPKATVYVDPKRNLLIMSGTQKELRQLSETVRIFDVDQLKGMSVGLFKLQAAEVKTVSTELEEVFGDSSDGPLAGLVRFVPIERLNTLLVITPQHKYLEDAKRWIERLDKVEEASGLSLHVYYVENGKAQHLAQMLTEIFQVRSTGKGKGKSTGSGAKSPSPLRKAKLVQSIGKKSEKSKPAVRTVPEQDSNFELGEVVIAADEENNALLIMATAGDYAKLERAIRKLDILPLQVLVEASIVEVRLTGDLSYGLEWFFRNHRNDYSGTGTLIDRTADFAPSFTYTLFDGSGEIRALLSLLAADSKLHVLSSPSLMVLDNRTATIKVGDQVPIRTSETTSLGTSGDSPLVTSTIQYIDTGVLLKVTPRVNAGGMVVMDIAQEVSDVGQTTSSGIDSPTILQRNISSSVAVHSGETIVLGGLIREGEGQTASGIPGLRDIPGIGYLFGSRTKSTDRTELLVLITPTAVTDRNDIREATEEMRQKMKGLDISELVAQPKPNLEAQEASASK